MFANDAGQFGLELAEVGASNGHGGLRIKLAQKATPRIIGSVLAALRESELKPSQLSPAGKQPLKLSEPAGIRLALVILGTGPISQRTRIAAVEEGVAAMSTEESYYWYAKCTGHHASRSRRALRLLLADE